VTQDWKAFGYNAFHDAVLQAEAPQTYDNHNAQAVIWDKMNVPTFVDSLPGMKGTRLAKLASESAQGEWGPPGDVSGLGMLWQWAYNTSKKTAHSYQSKSYLWSEGTDARWHVQGGNDGIVEGMEGELPAGTIKTNSPVSAIAKNADGTYKLTVKSGSRNTTVTVDHVVIAVPFSALRANVNLSKAGLSPLKMTAINNLGMTTQGKVWTQFNGHPWYQYNYSYVLVDSPVGWFWEANYQTNNNTSPRSIQAHLTIDGVTEQLISKYNLIEHEGIPPAGLVNEFLPGLDTWYGPGVSAAYNGQSFYDFGVMDKWAKGAWPYWKPGQVTGFSGIEGKREGNIHFAGDCTDWNFLGYMEGALVSGERVAAEI
jgi:monoamine oxidase